MIYIVSDLNRDSIALELADYRVVVNRRVWFETPSQIIIKDTHWALSSTNRAFVLHLTINYSKLTIKNIYRIVSMCNLRYTAAIACICALVTDGQTGSCIN